MVIFAVKIQKKKQARAECTSGRTHSLYVDPSGSVWSCGNNENGELGLGHNTSILVPQKINNLPPIISVSACGGFTLFVDANGSAWSCGYNQNGRLGLGDENNRNIPEQITNLPKIVSAIALGYSSIFLDCEVSVWACGNNSRGSLGLGDTTNKNRAKKIQGLPAVKSMAGGWHWSMFVDEQGNVWVCGANEKGELGLGHTTQINSPHKNKNLSGIVAVGGGQRCSVFLDNAGNIYTCGNNKYGQLGLGDKDHRHTPQKVNNIPPMSCISCSNIADRYLQIVDEEGRVWSCGRNEHGQLGLGHTNTTRTFQRTEIIIKLKQLQGDDEKELFKSIEKVQNKQLMNKVKHLHNVSKEQAKQKIIEGVIGMADWPSKWKDIHAKNQQLHEPIEGLKVNLNNKQQKLDKLTQIVREIKEALSTMEEQKEVAEFFDIFLEPIAEAEKELKSGFEEKFPVIKRADWTHWGVDEVSLFLNVCGMEDTVIHQRQMQIDGEVLGDAMEDVTVMEIKDRVQKRKMEFYLKVLHSGKMGNEQELSQNVVWRHREVEKTLALLKEWDIGLDENVVRKKGLSICELLYFKAKDFKEELGVEMKEAREMVRKVQCIKKPFEEFIERRDEDLFDHV